MTSLTKIALPAGCIVLIAERCHEANRAYCATLGDVSQKPWSEAPDWQRASAINGVEFHLANPNAGDSASHDNWMAVKLADGWKHGAKKDEKKKEHPCLVPFDQLPEEQREKDRIFRQTVHHHAEQFRQAIRFIETAVAAYLDANLADLVAAAMPETPEQQAQRQRDSDAEIVAKQAAAAARKAKAAEKAQAKADAEAAAKRAAQAEQAAKAFAQAEPFTGSIADITKPIVRGILIDDGKAYNPDLRIEARLSDLEPLTDGSGLLLAKPIDLPARGAEFTVQGVSLVTDAGVLRIALNGTRKCGGGKAVHFPARSLLFRPTAPRAADETGADAE